MLIGEQRLKEGGANFARRIIPLKLPSSVISSFQITINDYHYAIQSLIFQNYQLFSFVILYIIVPYAFYDCNSYAYILVKFLTSAAFRDVKLIRGKRLLEGSAQFDPSAKGAVLIRRWHSFQVCYLGMFMEIYL